MKICIINLSKWRLSHLGSKTYTWWPIKHSGSSWDYKVSIYEWPLSFPQNLIFLVIAYYLIFKTNSWPSPSLAPSTCIAQCPVKQDLWVALPNRLEQDLWAHLNSTRTRSVSSPRPASSLASRVQLRELLRCPKLQGHVFPLVICGNKTQKIKFRPGMRDVV